MTQDNLTNNISIDSGSGKKTPFFTPAMAHNFRANIKQNMKIFIVLIALHFAAMPLILLSAIIQIGVTNYRPDMDIYGIIGAFTTIAGAAAGIVCAMSCFNYLYNKGTVDMRLSLPMSTAQRFVSDFLSGLFIYVIPFLLNQVITFILMVIGHAMYDGRTFISPLNTYYDQITGQYEPITWECHLFEQMTPVLWRGIVGGVALLLMFYIFSVIVTSCCGSIFECVAYILLTNILIPLSLALVFSAVSENVDGLVMESYITPILISSPGGGVFGLIASLKTLDYTDYVSEYAFPVMEELGRELNIKSYSGYMNFITYPKWLVMFLIANAVFGVVSWLIYRRRRAEDTGKPIVYSAFYHFIMTLAIIGISYSFMIDGMDYSNIVPMIIVTLVVYLLFNVIRKRGFKGIVKAAVICVGMLVLSTGSLLLIYRTGGLGAGAYVPSPDSVASVTTNYSGMFTAYNDFSAELTDPECIGVITEAHKNITDRLSNESEENMSYVDNIIIKYKLKSGRVVIRSYSVTGNELAQIFSRIDNTESIKKMRAYIAAEKAASAQRFLTNVLAIEESDTSRLYVKLEPKLPNDEGIKKSYSGLPGNFCETVANCIVRDILNENEKDYFTPSGRTWLLSLYTGSLNIKENYTETLAYLKECGFDPLPQVDESLTRRIINAEISISMESVPLREYMTGEDIISSTRTYPFDINFSHTYYDYVRAYYYGYDGFMNEKLTEDITFLLANCYSTYKTDESCYTISVGGRGAVIPAEYSSTAEKVYICLAAQTALGKAEQIYSYSDYYDYYGYEDDMYYYDQEVMAQMPDMPVSTNDEYYAPFMRSLIDFYGKEKITSVLREYYPNMYAELYSLMETIARSNAQE